MKKKKNFILLELLIAFALVSSTIIPFLRFPYTQMQQEIEFLFEMELERIACQILAEKQIELYQNKIPAEVLFGNQTFLPLKEDLTVSLYEMQRKFIKKISIKKEKQKTDKNLTQFSLIAIQVDIYSLKNRKKPVLSSKARIIAEKRGGG